MRLLRLPERDAPAALNMALDLLLLQRFPDDDGPAVRFRTYGWTEPAFTFGLSQAWDWVQGQLPAVPGLDVCRRPTGGGIVDHRTDLTFALVLPRGHAWCEADARESYRLVHQALADALRAQGQPVRLQPPPDDPAAGGRAPTVCFEHAEVYDVVREGDGRKVAGAAQKRNRHGLLLQGSIERRHLGPGFDGERLGSDFAAALADAAVGAMAEDFPWPDFGEDETALAAHHASEAWIRRR